MPGRSANARLDAPNGAIQVHVPRIRHREDLVTFTHRDAAARQLRSEADQLISRLINVHLAKGTRAQCKQYQIFLLSRLEDPDTILLDQPIHNDITTDSGRPWPWTMGQRYVSLSALTRTGISATSDLASR